MTNAEENTNLASELEEESWSFVDVDEPRVYSASEDVSTLSENAYSESDVGLEYQIAMARLKERILSLEAELTKERCLKENHRDLVFKLKRELEDANKAMLEQKTVMQDVVLVKRQELKRRKHVQKRKPRRVKILRKAMFNKQYRVREQKGRKTSKQNKSGWLKK